MDWFVKSLVAYASKRGDWLLSQGYPPAVVEMAEGQDNSPNQKYVVWLANIIRNKIARNMEVRPRDVFRTDEWKGRSHSLGMPIATTRRIIDWAKANSINIMQWEYEDAAKAQEEWHSQMKASEDESLAAGYKSETVHDFGNGWKMVALVPSDCHIEGELMGHCVGGYAEYLENDDSMWIYSLRDPKNMPHVTIQVGVGEHEGKPYFEIEQIQGKENNPPIDKYAAMVKEWVEHLRKNVGVVEWYDNRNPDIDDDDLEEYESNGSPYDRYGLANDSLDIDTPKELIEQMFKEIDIRSRNWQQIAQNTVHYVNDHVGLKPSLTIDSLREAVYEEMNEIHNSHSENYVQWGASYPSEDDFLDDDGDYDQKAYEEAVGEYEKAEQEAIDYSVREDSSYIALDEILDTIKYMESQKVKEEQGVAAGAVPRNRKTAQLNDSFMEWFGDSQIVGTDGNPLPVYHGSPNSGLSNLSKQHTAFGYFFSPDEMTAEYYTAGEGKVYSAYLKVDNLLDLTDERMRSMAFHEVFGGSGTERMTEDKYGELKEVDNGDLMGALVEIYDDYPELLNELTSLAPSLSEIDDEYTPLDAFHDSDLSWLDIDLMDDNSNLKRNIDEMFKTVDENAMSVERAYGSQDFYMNYQDDFMIWARHNGYDGVFFDDYSPTGEALSYVVFSPSQIRFIESSPDSHNVHASTFKLAQSRELIYINRSGGLPPVEVVKNPSSEDYQKISREFKKEYPHSPGSWSLPKTRSTYDPEDNTYIWRSDMGLHEQIEPQLAITIGKPVNQNKYFEIFEHLYPDVNLHPVRENAPEAV